MSDAYLERYQMSSADEGYSVERAPINKNPVKSKQVLWIRPFLCRYKRKQNFAGRAIVVTKQCRVSREIE